MKAYQCVGVQVNGARMWEVQEAEDDGDFRRVPDSPWYDTEAECEAARVILDRSANGGDT